MANRGSCVRRRLWAHLLPRLALLAVFACHPLTTMCRGQSMTGGLTPQEEFVLEQVIEGKCVVFSSEAPKVEDIQQDLCRNRVVWAKGRQASLRSEFIEKLLLGKFNRTNLSRFVMIDGAEFRGPLSVRNADIQMEVRLTNSQFDDDLDFSTSHFRAPFSLNGSRFTKSNLNFNSMQVSGGLFLNGIEVPGTAEFYHLDVKGDVFIKNARFTNRSATVEFGEADIKGDMFVENSMFAGSLSMTQSNLKGLNLKSVRVGKKLDLGHAHIEKVFELSLVGKPDPIVLAGLIYGDLSPGGVDENLKILIDEESKNNYNSQSYSQLESYYRIHGLPEEADNVFVQSKRIERRTLSGSAKVSSYFLDGLVGYGRKPQKALAISLMVVFLGTVIFWRRRDMELQDSKSCRAIYNPFWYSLDLLTPIIDMDAARVWMPRENWWFGRNYARLHRILGWILVPIGLAAITGIIK